MSLLRSKSLSAASLSNIAWFEPPRQLQLALIPSPSSLFGSRTYLPIVTSTFNHASTRILHSSPLMEFFQKLLSTQPPKLLYITITPLSPCVFLLILQSAKYPNGNSATNIQQRTLM